MGEVLGMGLSHYPGPLVPWQYWPRHLQTQVERGRVTPEDFANQTGWPDVMRAEWGNDQGMTAAKGHAERLLAGYRKLRDELDAFNPDVVLIWGDDQYENFKKDCIPPFSVYLGDEAVSVPLADNIRGAFRTDENAWGLPPDTEMRYPCHAEAATALTRYLLQNDFDVSYQYTLRHARGLSHSFANTLVYLDYDREGWPYPIVPFHVNCYGDQLMTTSAAIVGESTGKVSPPAPSPRRCFNIGRATARFCADSPWRVALICSSSWSHGSLTKKHKRMYPDVTADRARYEELANGSFARWESLDLHQIEDSGQHEILNWVCLAGAMTELGRRPAMVDFVEAYIFNSTKCFALFPSEQAAAAV